MSNIIEIENMTKRFGKTIAVDNLNLTVPAGSIFAFLGPNGAGKTTTIKSLVNILTPDGGRAFVMGTPSTKLSPAEFRRIGYVSENQKMPDWMTVRQFIDYCAPMYPDWDPAFCDKLLKQFELPLDKKIKNLSRGMKVKAALLSSLAYHPELLVLDEPFTGLDPMVRDEFICGMLELTGQEKWTVFVSSHDIDEVERLADWVGIVNKGQLKVCESVASLQDRFRLVNILLVDASLQLSAYPENWLTVERTGKALQFVDSAHDEGAEARIRSLLPDCRDLQFTPMTLREIYLALARTCRISK